MKIVALALILPAVGAGALFSGTKATMNSTETVGLDRVAFLSKAGKPRMATSITKVRDRHWHFVGCAYSHRHCHHLASHYGFHHATVRHDHHRCHHHPHLACYAWN